LNYLAHIFLSGKNPKIQVGNFIGDFVKGKKPDTYPKLIRKGLILHRHIDSYTDSNKIVNETILLLRPSFGRYSGIITDMYFDYFLAKNFLLYSNGKPLYFFAMRFYLSALLNYRYLPTNVKKFIFHFIFTNRLCKYSTLKGFKDSLEIMTIRKVSALKPTKIIDFLVLNHDILESKFHQFFPDLIDFANGNNK
jgi:acyl carrier protein phosphodiesterase